MNALMILRADGSTEIVLTNDLDSAIDLFDETRIAKGDVKIAASSIKQGKPFGFNADGDVFGCTEEVSKG